MIEEFLQLIGIVTVAFIASVILIGGFYYLMWGYLPWWDK